MISFDSSSVSPIEAPDNPVISGIAGLIRNRWQRVQDVKRRPERQMLRNLRQRVGMYEPDVLAEINKFGGSDVYARVTDSKCRTAAAVLLEVLTATDRPWDLSPTPVADLPPDIEQQVQQEQVNELIADINALAMQGMQFDDAFLQQVFEERMVEAMDAAKVEIQKIAAETTGRMRDVIDDQFKEGKFKKALRQAIQDDFVTYGTMILKAPVIEAKTQLEWSLGESGQVQPVVGQKIVPCVQTVCPLDLYPSEDATNPNEGYLIERYPVSRQTLGEYRNVPGFKEDAVLQVLEMTRNGRGLPEYTTIESERRLLEKSDVTTVHPDCIDVLIYHGYVPGHMLEEWGASVDDLFKEYNVEAWSVKDVVIRIAFNTHPLGHRPYHMAHYANRPGGFWGIGIPELMEDLQKQANAAARAVANNMALASGPQVARRGSEMAPGTDDKIYPWKIWDFDEAYASQGGLPIQFFQPNMHSQELMAIYEKYVAMADDVTGIPRYLAGNEQTSGAAKTASGLSMLMTQANRTLRNVVANIDSGAIEPVVYQFWLWNMLFNPDQTIKGDINVVAKGSTSLMIKEQLQLRRQEMLNSTNNPVDLQIMGYGRRAELLRQTAIAMDMDPDDIAPEQEEIEQQMMLAQQQAMSGVVQ